MLHFALTPGSAAVLMRRSPNWPAAAYGVLYNPAAVKNPNLFTPPGWRVPTTEDVVDLVDYLGGPGVAGGKLKKTDVWEDPNTGATNETGFSAVPAGNRKDDGTFDKKTKKIRILIDTRF